MKIKSITRLFLLPALFLMGCSDNDNDYDGPDYRELTGKVVINEVYTFSTQDSTDDLDWIELYNTTDTDIDLGGLLIWEAGGPEEAWTIPAGTIIPAKGHLVIESDRFGLHGDPVNYPAWGLSKGPDEKIVLADGLMNIIDEISLPSMNVNESYGRVTDGDDDWQIFAHYTKGEENTGDPRTEHINTRGVWVNEVYHDNSKEADWLGPNDLAWDYAIDFIELYNDNDEKVDISGWVLYDDTDNDDKKYVIPAGTEIPAKGFLTYDVFKENENGPTFGLGVGGDWVFLYTSENKSELVDVLEVPGFTKESGWRDHGYTFGRYTDGSSNLVIFTEGSKNASNNGKAILTQD